MFVRSRRILLRYLLVSCNQYLYPLYFSISGIWTLSLIYQLLRVAIIPFSYVLISLLSLSDLYLAQQDRINFLLRVQHGCSFQHIVCTFGVPRLVIYDRDPRFTSNFWQDLQQCFGTRVAMSSAYHPQSDGQTEWAHRTMEQVSLYMLSKRQLPTTDWDYIFTQVEFACNTAVSNASQIAAAQLVFGQRLLQPVDVLLCWGLVSFRAIGLELSWVLDLFYFLKFN